MEATVRLLDEEPNVAVRVLWRGSELNLLRAKDELVERFVLRLALSCGKHSVSASSRKRAKKEQRKLPAGDGSGPTQPANASVAVYLIDGNGAQIPADMQVATALRRAAHIEIEGERVPVSINPQVIHKLGAFGHPLAGCPLIASLRCEFCEPEAFALTWLEQAAPGGEGSSRGQQLGEGRVFWVPDVAIGKTLMLRADPREAGWKTRAATHVGLVEQLPRGWPGRRLQAFAPCSSSTAIRVVSFNTLAAAHAKTQTAVRELYPYCPPRGLDLAYRQPQIGRELWHLGGDVLCIQECSPTTFRKFLAPLLGERYHARITLKAGQVSEGCALFVKKGAFDVIEEKEFLFRDLVRSSEALRPMVREARAKWPDFLSGVLPHLSTIFQVSVVRHRVTGEILVIANTHLFFHPLARHIRVLQVMCLLQQVHEMREHHRLVSCANGAQPPRIILCGDLNCGRPSGALELLLEGTVPSSHGDWECATQFTWRHDEAPANPAEEGDEDGDEGQPAPGQPTAGADEACGGSDDIEPLPQEECQPGLGLTLRSPLGPLRDTYAGAPLAFTNYVNNFNATLDYILTDGRSRVLQTLPGISGEDLKPEGGLPNLLYPSDHLSIAADLELTEE